MSAPVESGPLHRLRVLDLTQAFADSDDPRAGNAVFVEKRAPRFTWTSS